MRFCGLLDVVEALQVWIVVAQAGLHVTLLAFDALLFHFGLFVFDLRLNGSRTRPTLRMNYLSASDHGQQWKKSHQGTAENSSDYRPQPHGNSQRGYELECRYLCVHYYLLEAIRKFLPRGKRQTT